MNLNRFLAAEQDTYASALSELRAGSKQGCWMWFIFPQIEGPGESLTSRFFVIKSLKEATAYLARPVLGPRLIECCEAILLHPNLSASDILGSPDDLKLRSCATLFAQVEPPHLVFERIFSPSLNLSLIIGPSNCLSSKTSDFRLKRPADSCYHKKEVRL